MITAHNEFHNQSCETAQLKHSLAEAQCHNALGTVAELGMKLFRLTWDTRATTKTGAHTVSYSGMYVPGS